MNRNRRLALYTVLVLLGWLVSIVVVWRYWNPNAATLVGILYLPAVAVLSSLYTELL